MERLLKGWRRAKARLNSGDMERVVDGYHMSIRLGPLGWSWNVNFQPDVGKLEFVSNAGSEPTAAKAAKRAEFDVVRDKMARAGKLLFWQPEPARPGEACACCGLQNRANYMRPPTRWRRVFSRTVFAAGSSVCSMCVSSGIEAVK